MNALLCRLHSFKVVVLTSALLVGSQVLLVGPPSATATSKAMQSSNFRRTSNSACVEGQLSIAAGSGNGAAGTAFQTIIVVNDSMKTCWLSGYPTITLSTGASKIDRDEVHERTGVYANPKPRLVILGPSQVASVGISYNDVGYTNVAGVEAICRTYRTINVKWRTGGNLLWTVHLSQMSYPCGGWFAVTPFEVGALPKTS